MLEKGSELVSNVRSEVRGIGDRTWEGRVKLTVSVRFILYGLCTSAK